MCSRPNHTFTRPSRVSWQSRISCSLVSRVSKKCLVGWSAAYGTRCALTPRSVAASAPRWGKRYMSMTVVVPPLRASM